MKFDILISGFGEIAKRHIINLLNLNCVSSLTIVKKTPFKDGDLSFESSCPVFTYTDFDKAISERHFELAVIASPANHHLDQVKKLTSLGVSCFIEKPISKSTFEARELINHLEFHKVYCCVGYDLVKTIGFYEVQKILAQSLLGNLWRIEISVGQYLADWRPNKDYRSTVSTQKCLGGGALRELSHELDYFIALFDIDSINFNAQLLNHTHLMMDCENEVNVFGDLKLESQNNRASFSIHLDMLKRNAARTLRVEGLLGSLEWDLIQQQIILIINGGEPKIINVNEDGNMPYLRLMADFVELSGNVSFNADLYRGMAVMDWISLIELAAVGSETFTFHIGGHYA